MELIVISSPTAIADEGEHINTLFKAGLKCFHLRKPESDVQSVRQLLNEIDVQFHEWISLHQFHGLAADYGLKRLHFPEALRNALTEQEIQLKLKGGYILSTSVHDVSKLPSLLNFDYVFYGPVFNSISKTGYKSTVATDFKLEKVMAKPKVIAIGGVEVSKLKLIQKMGFDGAAVLGTLWKDPEKTLSNFNELKNNLPKHDHR
ncbi:thiamine phosphate synthase [Pedobacter sp. MC2016-14]|uniref:thiamine phosphate synthase n=1 Tax=Pedobacter sp. MC2016-14 TaxID=2897327 RepID=UPI001E540F4D|nr:thiamine phosphate synthase [Pedobacter sp. MC2016-14]MCD0489904.1 thiamine phosphate synthase [Pedobacter sp. MC2016-14]